MKKTEIKNIVIAGLCLALCMVLPILTGQIPEIGKVLSPMHIPVLICGLVCGWPYGALVGFIAPFLRFLMFGMPPIMPVGLAMAFEMAAYGCAGGMLYKILPKKIPFLYISLVAAMLIGRVVWGISMYIIMVARGGAFTWAAFMAGAFINAVPGIICHIILVPLVVIALKKAGYMQNEQTR